MKYWIIGIVLVTLGFGEYVFVQVAPYPPERRLAQAGKIAILKPFTTPFQKAAAFRRLEEYPDGWPKEGLYRQEYQIAKRFDDEDRMAMARKSLENLNTNISRWYLYLIDHGRRPRPVENWEVERAILHYSMVEDMYGNYGTTLLQELGEKADLGDDWAIRIVEAIEE